MINIVIPALNEEFYIGELLESLTKQSYKDFDVTVVDGNSTDKTQEIVLAYQKKLPNLQLITTKVHNVSFQRNLGAKQGTAEYILFLDSDVRLHRHFLSHLLKGLRNRQVANCWLIPLSDQRTDKILYNLYNIFFLEFGRYIWPVGVGNNLFTTRVIFNEISGFDRNVKTWEDVDYIQRAISAGARFAILRKPKIYASVRRFKMQGRLNYLIENLKGLQYAIRTGRMPDHINYPMGIEYRKLHVGNQNPKEQQRLQSYYNRATRRIKFILKHKLLLKDFDILSQETMNDVTQILKKILR